MLEKMGKTLFFRSGNHPLILSEEQREERKACKWRMDRQTDGQISHAFVSLDGKYMHVLSLFLVIYYIYTIHIHLYKYWYACTSFVLLWLIIIDVLCLISSLLPCFLYIVRAEQLLSSSGIPCMFEKKIPVLSHEGNTAPVKESRRDPTPADTECGICMNRVRDCLLCPCHHMITCYECSKMLHNRRDGCPICRKDITEVIRVYHS